jgi:hypothetical protein
MRSFIKIYGPPVFEAIKVLEKIAVDMPEVCIMDTIIQSSRELTVGMTPEAEYTQLVSDYFSPVSDTPVSVERCSKIISSSGQVLGEYDFFFEWFQDPSTEQLNDLIEKIDTALATVGCRYTITTKS